MFRISCKVTLLSCTLASSSSTSQCNTICSTVLHHTYPTKIVPTLSSDPVSAKDLSHTGEYAKRTLYQLSHTP
ncbi:hypothetical protein B0T17DRAFT_534659 [Bombardia bombarda]|uniref:Secreted protein n=1 Tax=Bombardia bombarda TaxID=252184 RepID=A0AA39WU24_9PEZI|nr:hypothetical protein B0T17DRAFT_534659 [Bombardia bombarda]